LPSPLSFVSFVTTALVAVLGSPRTIGEFARL
jgi:hypothetical protein